MAEAGGFTVFPDGAVLLLPYIVIHACIVPDFYLFLYSFRSFFQQFISIFHSVWKMESSCWFGINLKHAWFFVFDSLEYPFDLRYMRHINAIIETNLIRDAGVVRNISVRIPGTDWIHEIPSPEKIDIEINRIRQIENPTDRSLELMLSVMERTVF